MCFILVEIRVGRIDVVVGGWRVDVRKDFLGWERLINWVRGIEGVF